MYKEFSTNTKDEDMFLSTEDTYSSGVEMLGGEQLNIARNEPFIGFRQVSFPKLQH
jgi:hypothetical protein